MYGGISSREKQKNFVGKFMKDDFFIYSQSNL